MHEIDLLAEDTSVEVIVRRLQQRARLRRRAAIGESGELVLEGDEREEFSNIHLSPELFFQLDYAARIFDPRDTPGNTRFIAVKRAVQRVMRVYTTRQVEFNATVVRVLKKLFDILHEIVDKFNYFRRAEVALIRRIEYVEGALRDIYKHRTRLEALEEEGRQLNRRVSLLEDLRNRLELALAENIVLRQRLEDVLAHAASAPPAPSGYTCAASAADTPAASAQLNNDHLYFPYLNADRAIEDVIRERVRYYLPFFNVPEAPPGYIVDIGCGRGEFLDVCRAAGVPCRGIDLNEDMVRHCQTKGLDVTQAGALDYLQAQTDGSLRGIIACHVLEHLPPLDVMTFLRLCMRKLAPGGRLVIETPNPKSVFGMTMFYRDFTHQKPLHPYTLKFLLEQLGAQHVSVEELHRAPEQLELVEGGNDVINANFRKLNEIVYGFLDYAVMAVR